jgi:hypothetical protein
LEDIEAEIELVVNEFDEGFKPTFNGTCRPQPFRIPGLPNNPEKGFRNSCVWFSASVSMGPSSSPVLLTACREEMCEQVFDEIVNTIVMKVQRQIDESRRIAKEYDGEPDLHIEVRATRSPISRSLLSYKQGHHPRGRLFAEPLPEGQDAWSF